MNEDLKRRVQKRFARGASEPGFFAEHAPGLLRARAVRELALRSICPSLSEPTTPTLEDLFIEMTTERAAEALLSKYGGVA